MPQNKNLNSSIFSKIASFCLSFVIVLGLCFSFSPVVTAQPTTAPAKSTPAKTTSPAPSSGGSGESIKPVDLCAGGGSAFIEGACLIGTEQYASGDGRSIITNLTTNLVSLLIFIGAATAVFFIVLGGYKLITSNGDEKTAKEGKDMVFNTIIGLVIVMLSYTIITVTTGIISNLDIGGK